MTAHVLLIEDEPNISEAIRFILSRDGCTVTTLNDGAGMAETLRKDLPDLVILDLMLPGISGMELLVQLRADPATQNLP